MVGLMGLFLGVTKIRSGHRGVRVLKCLISNLHLGSNTNQGVYTISIDFVFSIEVTPLNLINFSQLDSATACQIVCMQA